MQTLDKLLAQDRLLLADGAMGTMLFDAGLQFGDPPEAWNLDYPDRVKSVHSGYLQSGADIILTNTFGGNRFRLALHKMDGRVIELNRAGADLARDAVAANGGRALVAGDIGPSGEILAPLGTLAYEDAVAGFAEQAAALLDGGVDVMWIETISALEEMQAAMEGVRQVSADMPIIATMTFDTRGHTMMGVTPEQAVQAVTEWGAAMAGGNCGNGPEEIIAVIEKMHAALPAAALVAKSNAGVPELVNGKVVYGADPDRMADYARTVKAAGARMVGSCCGSTPAHVRAMAAALELVESPV